MKQGARGDHQAPSSCTFIKPGVGRLARVSVSYHAEMKFVSQLRINTPFKTTRPIPTQPHDMVPLIQLLRRC